VILRSISGYADFITFFGFAGCDQNNYSASFVSCRLPYRDGSKLSLGYSSAEIVSMTVRFLPVSM
jgi:hypothetical protein